MYDISKASEQNDLIIVISVFSRKENCRYFCPKLVEQIRYAVLTYLIEQI